MAFIESTGTPSYDIYPSGYVRDISSWIDRQEWERTGGYAARYQSSTAGASNQETNLQGATMVVIILLAVILLSGK